MQALAASLYGDDPEFQAFDDRERATHWFFKVGDKWLRWPKPFELAALSNIAERAYEGIAKQDPTAGRRLASDLRHVLIPPVNAPIITVPVETLR